MPPGVQTLLFAPRYAPIGLKRMMNFCGDHDFHDGVGVDPLRGGHWGAFDPHGMIGGGVAHVLMGLMRGPCQLC